VFVKKQTKSVDSVLAAFDKTIQDLHEVAAHHCSEADRHAEVVVKATEAKAYADAEAARAVSVATKIRKLLS
jgi:hypothetical protein